jgi:hypothetical protein
MAFVAFTEKSFRQLDQLLTTIRDKIQAIEVQLSEGVRQYVEDWLDSHPEATTTVEDGSITARKLNVTVTYTVDSNGNLTITLE